MRKVCSNFCFSSSDNFLCVVFGAVIVGNLLGRTHFLLEKEIGVLDKEGLGSGGFDIHEWNSVAMSLPMITSCAPWLWVTCIFHSTILLSWSSERVNCARVAPLVSKVPGIAVYSEVDVLFLSLSFLTCCSAMTVEEAQLSSSAFSSVGFAFSLRGLRFVKTGGCFRASLALSCFFWLAVLVMSKECCSLQASERFIRVFGLHLLS